MEERKASVDLIITTYRPDEKLGRILSAMEKQSVPPAHIYLMNTEEALLPRQYKEMAERREDMTIVHLPKAEFDHGATRAAGMELSSADYVLMMTQDAVPADSRLIESLLLPMQDEKVGVSYARQLCGKEAGAIEQFTRNFNYPPVSAVKTKEDIKALGIKAFFCSDACALYRKSAYQEQGGFVKKAIFNEDMIMAYRLLQGGYKVAYEAGAKVVHAHRYTFRQQFTRNFDLGVSHRMYREIFEQVKSESEGVRLVKQTAGYLLKQGKWYLIPELVLVSGFKFLGYQFGKRYHRLPRKLVVKWSMNKGFWNREGAWE